jgi:hypothetical protein
VTSSRRLLQSDETIISFTMLGDFTNASALWPNSTVSTGGIIAVSVATNDAPREMRAIKTLLLLHENTFRVVVPPHVEMTLLEAISATNNATDNATEYAANDVGDNNKYDNLTLILSLCAVAAVAAGALWYINCRRRSRNHTDDSDTVQKAPLLAESHQDAAASAAGVAVARRWLQEQHRLRAVAAAARGSLL